MPDRPDSSLPVERALAVGVFDLFHVGHLRYLQYVRARCRHLAVLVASDATVLDRKGRAPLFPEAERLELIRGLGWVDDAFLLPQSMEYPEPTLTLFRQLAPTCIFIGADWQGTPRWQRLEPPLQAMGIAVRYVPRTADISTTDLRRRIGGGLA